ncbi:glycosyltransferase family 4 protein [Polaromonas sp. AER18D-145]|uniref:glycosyltransferase family 4 protein n=1 Tax=Polaromonas sp. AER18D-145 TaxID=1977060 RepID=UPI001481E077|nr:glycosyltransferase family 4 protein [Polaromonas sp. AER18D-145]
MKRLLVFTENYARGGGNRYMIDLVNAGAADFDEVVLAANVGGLFAEDLARLERPAVHRRMMFFTRVSLTHAIRGRAAIVRRAVSLSLLLLEPLLFLINVLAFVALLLRLRPTQVLSCNGGYPAAQACLAMAVGAKLVGIPVALSIVSMPTARRAHRQLYEKAIDHLVWWAITIVIVNAEAIAAALGTLRDMPAGRVAVVYNGLEDLPVSRAVGDPAQRFVIGCIARMDALKGVLFLLDAFAALAPERPALRLVLAGEGDASGELVRRTAELGLQDRVCFLGHYAGDVTALLATFDVYVFPSLWEGFPYSIVEAMRSGCTIVATNVGGIPEAIANGQQGLLIQPSSSDEIITALERLIDAPDLRHTLARNARLKFEAELSLQKMYRRARTVLLRGLT